MISCRVDCCCSGICKWVAKLAFSMFAAVLMSATLTAASAADRYVLPLADPDIGRNLFVNKGCIVCHQVNGVGGTVAPPLDASAKFNEIDPYDLMARMWEGADAMLLLQAMELGYHIEFTAEEIAHIDRFLNDPEAQKRLKPSDIPEWVKDWMIDEFYEQL